MGIDVASRIDWSREKKLAFNVLEPAALCLVASDGPVSVTLWQRGGEVRRLGHNRAIWPGKIARTGQWVDKVSSTYDKNPFFFLGTQMRLWARSIEQRDLLVEGVLDLIAARAAADGGLADLDHDFRDLGPEFDVSHFELEVGVLADRLGIHICDNWGLSAYLDRVVEAAERMSRSGEVTRQLLRAVLAREARAA